MYDPVETLELDGFRAELFRDDVPENPRGWMTLGTMYCTHPRYKLGDVQVQDQEDLLAELLECYTDESLEDQWAEVDKNYVWLPLYLYEHSGITMNTSGFSCPWDSGQVGIIAVPKARALKAHGRVRWTRKFERRILEALDYEVHVYDQYLRGEVYGIRVLDPRGHEEDSCWEFFGLDYALECAQAMLQEVVSERRIRDPNGQLLLGLEA